MAPESSNDYRKAAMRNQIDENLRRIYHTALEDAVPERFTQLLQQLRDKGNIAPPDSDADSPAPQTRTEQTRTEQNGTDQQSGTENGT